MHYIHILMGLLLWSCSCIAQTRVYKNYGVKDGLASSTVYYTFQDKQGFMWFGTDQGLCRFDGTSFKTFTVFDGLPDNEVFRLAEDSMGRLWAICYNSKPCYIYKGKVHTADNDSLLMFDSGIPFFRDIDIDNKGRVWLFTKQYIYIVDGNIFHKVKPPDSSTPIGIGIFDSSLAMVTSQNLYKVSYLNGEVAYEYISTQNENINSCPVFTAGACYIIEAQSHEKSEIVKVTKTASNTVSLSGLGIKTVIWSHNVFSFSDSLLIISAGMQGIKAFDTNLHQVADPFPFLPAGIKYTYTCFDRDGNVWISSLGKGVFFIPYQKVMLFNAPGQIHAGATSVLKTDENLIIGYDNATYSIGNNKIRSVNTQIISGKRIIRLCSLNDSTIIMGADFGLYSISKTGMNKHTQLYDACIKSLAPAAKDSFLVGTVDCALVGSLQQGRFRFDTLWNKRTTAIAKDSAGGIWLGTLNGLFVYEKGSIKKFSSNAFINQSRITDLLCGDGNNVWVGTHQRGLFVITQDSVIAINSLKGLPGDMCVRLFRESAQTIWVCSNKSLSRINYSWQKPFLYDVLSYDIPGSDDMLINDISTDSAHIWLATTDGVYSIPKQAGRTGKSPPVYIVSFRAADSVYTALGSLDLNYRQNNIQIDYVGISYNNTGKVKYKYFFSGSADTVFTTNNSINLSSLPPESYRLYIWAKDVSGIWSVAPATIQFIIHPPFWKTWWFIAILIVTAVITVYCSIVWRIKKIQAQAQQKVAMDKKIAQTMLQAVRAQMNEHFIFNSLNSIQNFINQNDIEAANFYLANFGKLIRRTLDISTMSATSLQDEIDYLNNYLILEKMRFGNKFEYFIQNQIMGIAAAQLNFPSMILQPYVENAIRHGLRHKQAGPGKLEIKFEGKNNTIICTIDDNGIGRKAAEKLKSNTHVEYQSRGIKLSEDKISLYNQINNDSIKVATTDKTGEDGQSTGTLVTVIIPYNTIV